MMRPAHTSSQELGGREFLTNSIKINSNAFQSPLVGMLSRDRSPTPLASFRRILKGHGKVMEMGSTRTVEGAIICSVQTGLWKACEFIR